MALTACSGSGDDTDGSTAAPVATASTTDAPTTSDGPTTTEGPTTTDDPSGGSTTTDPDGTTSPTTDGTDPTSASTSTTVPSTGTTIPGASTTSVPGDPTTSVPTDPTATTVPPTTVPALDVYDPTCVVKVLPGESLSLIADRFEDEVVTVRTIMAENGLSNEVIHPDQLLDICPGNSLNDITGDQRLEPNDAVLDIQNRGPIIAQQEKLNVLFDGLGIAPLKVDGISGPVTRQRLCAFRVAMGFPASTADMVPGSDEEIWLNVMPSLPVPESPARNDERWVLIDKTCQIMFVGAGPEQLVYVFPTSTGDAEHETRLQQRTRAFKYDPATENGGWHNSTDFPAAEDNPLNGNMYKPIYFDGGQAIHGANTVPTSPQSKGCARLRIEHQELLVAWLGLGDVTRPLYNANRINLRVAVQGQYVPA